MSELFPAKTIAIEEICCTDQEQIKEFNLWYDTVHIKALKETRGVVDVYRYLDVQKDFGELGSKYVAPEGTPARYLTIYRLNSDNPWELMKQIKEDDKKRAAEGKMMDCYKSNEYTVWDFVATRQSVQAPVRPETRLPDGMPEAILLVYAGMDPDKKLEHDHWWLYVHAHDLLEVPGMTQCSRYLSQNPNPEPDDATLLNVYEFDCNDPAAAFQKILEDDKYIRRIQGRFSPYSRRTKNHSSGVYVHWDIMGPM